MPSQIYEVVAQGARYWFLFLMVLIAWRSWRWYRRDKRKMKKRLRLLPDAGYVGEMVVTDGGGVLKPGAVFALPWEGTLGSLRTNDLCLPVSGVSRRHLWFRFDEGRGLMVEPLGKNPFTVDGAGFVSRRTPLYMAHGSRLQVGDVQLRLRLFAGFESVGRATYAAPVEPEPVPQPMPEQPQQPMPDYETQRMMQQMLMQQQWLMEQYRQQQAQQQQQPPAPQPIQRDDSVYMRPADQAPPPLPVYEDEPLEEEPISEPAPVFYPPEMDEEAPPEDPWPYAPNPWADEEDMTDAAAELPRSAYVGHDEAETAKKKFWDRYFGGDRP